MKLLARSLIVWLMLLAVPFQGFASAIMLSCVHAPALPAVATAEMAATGHACHATAMAAHAPESDALSAHHAKCGSCAACCIGAAIAPAEPTHSAAQAPGTTSIPFTVDHVPTVHLALPERPPQSSLA